MKKLISTLPLCGLLLATSLTNSPAQTTAIWTGPASGGEWNTPTSWITGAPPLDSTTNAFIGVGTNVNYNSPMTAASFGALTNYGILNVNASGFNCSAISVNLPGGTIDAINITNSGSVVTVSGPFLLGTNGQATLATGASLTTTSFAVAGGETSHTSGTSTFTNSGGTLNTRSTSVGSSGNTGTGRLVISGGLNSLGNTSVGRYNSASASTLGTEGLAIYGGVVTLSNLNVSGGSYGTAYIAGGTVTNFNNVTINGTTAGRYLRVIQSAGLFVVPDPGIIYENATTAGNETARFQVNGGTNIVGGLYLGTSNSAVAATVTVAIGGVVYVGSQGITTNGAVLDTITLNAGGLLGATADWTGAANMGLNGSGTFTFQTGGPDAVSHNVTLTAGLSGTTATTLTKTGNGTLTLAAPTSYAGSTLINAGTLALGASGSLASTFIETASGTTFDVSALGGTFNLISGQTLSGFGTVNGLVAANNGTIQPGSNSITGTLTLASGLTEAGNVNNKFILSNQPVTGSNDLLVVTGDLTLSGSNTVTVVGSLPVGVNYQLIQYTGNFNGNITNLSLFGAIGYLTNNTTTKTIVLHTLATTRGPSSIVWVGNPVNNSWDTQVSTNWLNNGALDYFIIGDSVTFNAVGSAATNVNILATVDPAAVTVNATTNYFFTGNGAIDGPANLTKTNTGTLTILTTNTYTGITAINGGVLEAYQLANGGSASAIGAASSDSINFVISNGTFRYLGPTVSIDRGATLLGNGTIDVVSGTTLTLSGVVAGAGSLTMTDNGNLALNKANTYSGGSVLSAGTVTLDNAGGAGSGPIILNGGTLAVGAVKPSNTIIVTNDSLITGGNAGGSTGVKAITGSSNLVLAVTTGVFDLTGDMSTYSGTITCSNAGGGTVRFNGSIGSPLATWDLGSGTMDINIRTGSTSNNIGALKGGTSTTLSGRGGSGNSGSSTYYIGANNLNSTFDGVIQNGYGASGTTPSSTSPTSINKVGTGTLTLTGTSIYTGNTTISSGTLALTNNPNTGNDGSIGSSASINIVSGTILDVSGRSDSTLQLGSSAAQILEGRGTLNGNLNVQGSGTVAPGGGPGGNTGTLTVTNAVTLSGTAWMKLSRGNSPNSDRVVSSFSSITYGGTLVVTNIGAPLQPGDTFTLFSGSGLGASSFGTIVLPNYYGFDTSMLGVNGTITVTNAFRPAFSSVDFSALSTGTITINATNGLANGAVDILTTTNLLTGWTTNTSTTFNASGDLPGFSITVDPTASQLFIKLQGE